MTRDDAEPHVRRFLTFLEDPATLVDVEEVARLEIEFQETEDVWERLHAAGRLIRAEEPDPNEVRENFIIHVKDWATDNQISSAAFMRMGVPEADLREAGMPLPAAKASKKQRMTQSAVVKRVPSGTFSIRDYATVTGASPVTVRRVVDQMVKDGHVVSVGPDPDHRGVGRAPVLYKKTQS